MHLNAIVVGRRAEQRTGDLNLVDLAVDCDSSYSIGITLLCSMIQ